MTAEPIATPSAHTDNAWRIAAEDTQAVHALATLIEQARDTLNIVEMLLHTIASMRQDELVSADKPRWLDERRDWPMAGDLAGVVDVFRHIGGLTDHDVVSTGILTGRADW